MTWHCSWKKISCSSILFTPTAPISHIRQRVDVSPGTISQRERRRFHARANFSSAQYFSDWKPDLNIFHWWTWPCIIFLQFKSQTMPEKFSTGPVKLPALGLRKPRKLVKHTKNFKRCKPNPPKYKFCGNMGWICIFQTCTIYIYVFSYLDMKLRCKKQSQFLSLLFLLSHSLACLTSHFLLCATFHNFEQLGFCISSLLGELWQLEQGDKSCIKCPSLKWGITFGAESSQLVPLGQRRTQESKVTGSG